MIIVKLKVNNVTSTLIHPTKEQIIDRLNILGGGDYFEELVSKEFEALVSDDMCTSKMLIGGRKTFTMRKEDELDETHFHLFADSYAVNLQCSMDSSPDQYGPYDETLHNMIYSLATDNFNYNSPTFKQTCKDLKVKHTKKAINAYLRGN